MDISILSGINKCKNLKGVGVVIDVFRATTTIACILKAQPNKIIILPDAQDIKKYYMLENHVCFCELVLEGYDNSPVTALTSQIQGKTAVISTTNGTKGIIAAKECEKIITGAFINIDAVVDYLLRLQPSRISLIPVGHIESNTEAIEDSLCAQIIYSRVHGVAINEVQIRKMLLRSISDRKLNLNLAEDYQVYIDMLFCSSIGILDVVPEVIFDKDQICIVDALNRT